MLPYDALLNDKLITITDSFFPTELSQEKNIIKLIINIINFFIIINLSVSTFPFIVIQDLHP